MLYADGIHDDTLNIQAMLDQKGIVTIDQPGTYLITKTLVIRSNTRFILSPGAKLLAAPMSRCALIENEHFAGGGRDENIEIIGGIWDGNCDEMGLDAAYEAKHRLDDPYDPKLFKGKLIRFAHIDRLCLEKMTVRNPVSYGIQIADADGFVVVDRICISELNSRDTHGAQAESHDESENQTKSLFQSSHLKLLL